MWSDLLKLADQVLRRGHEPGCRCAECRAASVLIDGGAEVVVKVRSAVVERMANRAAPVVVQSGPTARVDPDGVDLMELVTASGTVEIPTAAALERLLVGPGVQTAALRELLELLQAGELPDAHCDVLERWWRSRPVVADVAGEEVTGGR